MSVARNGKKRINESELSCASCGIGWIAHASISATCAKLEAARAALKMIHDDRAMTPDSVWKLAHYVLKEIGA